MYLVRTDDQNELKGIAANIDMLDDVPHFDLANLNSLALVELHPTSSAWIAGQPIAFDEQSGIAIFKFADEGVNWLKENAEQLAEFETDPEAVRAFADAPGAGHVYAIDTF